MADAARVNIDDVAVVKLLNDPNARRTFPFLATKYAQITAGAKAGDCGGCRKKKTNNQAIYADVRRSIAQMPVTEKRKFRDLLKTKQVVVSYNNGRGKKITMKF